MYDVEKLVSVVCDYLDAEADYKKYSLDVRKELGLAPDSPLWIPSLNGSLSIASGAAKLDGLFTLCQLPDILDLSVGELPLTDIKATSGPCLGFILYGENSFTRAAVIISDTNCIAFHSFDLR